MSDGASKNSSETDWTRIDNLDDAAIDTSDIPPLDDAFFSRASVQTRSKATITVHLDTAVLSWFQAFGDSWEDRLNAALRAYVSDHSS